MSHRCFLAIKVPPVEFDASAIKPLGRIKQVDPDLLHFTIHFFGNISTQEIEKIKRCLSSLSFTPFTIVLDQPGYIPSGNPTKTRVLYIHGKRGESQLINLANKIHDLLRACGTKNIRSFLPHVTVARIKDSQNRRQIAEKWMATTIEPVKVNVDKVILVESLLTPNGPIYTDLISFHPAP